MQHNPDLITKGPSTNPTFNRFYARIANTIDDTKMTGRERLELCERLLREESSEMERGKLWDFRNPNFLEEGTCGTAACACGLYELATGREGVWGWGTLGNDEVFGLTEATFDCLFTYGLHVTPLMVADRIRAYLDATA